MSNSVNNDLQSEKQVEFIREKLDVLRTRLLDFTRRNPLVNINFRPNSATVIRVVDELPDVLRYKLTSGQKMLLEPLPSLEEELPDEQTVEFQEALFHAKREDEEYKKAIEDLDTFALDYAEQEESIERDLKDRVREHLGLPERQTKEKPSLVEQARLHGIRPDFELPKPDDENEDGRHTDDKIQTLQLPDGLLKRAKSIYEKGHSYERETGVNVLHMAFGILEWKAPKDPEKFISPLILLEIEIERRQSQTGPRFYVRGQQTAELNTTLVEKLKSDNSLSLPKYEGKGVEEYFQKVASIFEDEKQQKEWIWNLRREVVLGVFPSNKIAMYKDLGRKELASNLLVSRLLGSSSSASDPSFDDDDRSRDDPKVFQKVPHIVMDSDSSQYSVLVDVAEGKNLALEGPPGSGKSQTIVNLIASALYENKKVLFVAEKLAALDVVRSRLKAVGLGDFLLPLQPGRTSNKSVYESLKDRAYMAQTSQVKESSFETKRETYLKHRRNIHMYLDILKSELGSTEMTVYEAIGRSILANQIRESLPNEIKRIKISGVHEIGPADLEELLTNTNQFVEHTKKSDSIPSVWKQSQKIVVNQEEAEIYSDDLKAISERLTSIADKIKTSEVSKILPDNPFGVDFDDLLKIWEFINQESAKIDADVIECFLDQNERALADDLCDTIKKHRLSREKLAQKVLHLDDENLESNLSDAYQFALENEKEIRIARHKEKLKNIKDEIEILENQKSAIDNIPSQLTNLGNNDLHKLWDFAKKIADLPTDLQNLSIPCDYNGHKKLQREILSLKKNLGENLQEIQERLPKAGSHDREEVRLHSEVINESGIFRIIQPKYRRAIKFYYEGLDGQQSKERKIIARRLLDYADYLDKENDFRKKSEFRDAFGDAFEGINTVDETIQTLVDIQSSAFELAENDEQILKSFEIGDASELSVISETSCPEKKSKEELLADIETSKQNYEEEERRLEKAEFYLTIFGAQEVDASTTKNALKLCQEMNQASDKVKNYKVTSKLSGQFSGLDTDVELVKLEIACAEQLQNSINPVRSCEFIRKNQSEEIVSNIKNFGGEIKNLQKDVDSFSEDLEMDEGFSDLPHLHDRLSDLQEAFRNPPTLIQQGQFYRSKKRLEDAGFEKLIDWFFLQENFDVGQIPQIIEAIIDQNRAKYAYDLHGEGLSKYSGEDFEIFHDKAAEIDRDLLKISQKIISQKLVNNAKPEKGVGVGRKSEFTGMSLIRNELHKKKGKIPVRELTRRAGNALLELKPCWMMSPLAVAQYLQSNIEFDLVVIDEASQMTPENAIGAISRAKKVVVVGDGKQLPPTSFFKKIIDDESVDEDLKENSESILDMANTVFVPPRQLRWHYRSRHPSLIEFSNKWMYNNRLTIFPTPNEKRKGFGVGLVEVLEQDFDNDQIIYRSGTNDVEADAVVDAIVKFMESHPDNSLGVCTMNITQKDLIQEKFERERDGNRSVQEYIERWEEKNDSLEEFFIKNLEAIQGDERDVMFISTLYGPEKKGEKVRQTFGPINSEHGNRRLNVLFTRAKNKIVTFTSLKPSDISDAENKSQGARMLKAWLEYCKTGNVSGPSHPIGRPESPFEESIIQQVESLGYIAVPQVGQSGYRIDIGVKHEKWDYGYIMGIECDGASYHSSATKREDDRLRQEILENQGWYIYRIWSTDWFTNPVHQRELLKKELDSMLDALTKEQVEIIADKKIRNKKPEEDENEVGLLFDKIDEYDKSTPSFALNEIQSIRVKVGSEVELEQQTGNRSKMRVIISDRKNDPDKGIISTLVPLGEALLDAEEGDEVEFQVGSYIHRVLVTKITNPDE